jgi:hypothetical protein
MSTTEIFPPETREQLTGALTRLRDEPGLRTLLKLDPAAAFKELGMELPDVRELQKAARAALREQNVAADTDADVLAASARAMAHAAQPASAEGGASTATAGDQFYRGVPGYHAEAFWWGFHIPFSKADADDLVKTLVKLDVALVALTAAIAMIPKVNVVVVPFLAALVVYLFAEIIVIAAVNASCGGPGIWISMAWLAPGVFVPTCI